jgi:uncharacterized BrkB/YihY/UPF0761 family membrane protein
VLVWYYAVLSSVNLIYGSFATSVVALLSIEAIAIIILVGAQFLAELERRNPSGPLPKGMVGKQEGIAKISGG